MPRATFMWSCKLPAHCLCLNLCSFSCQFCAKMSFIWTIFESLWRDKEGSGIQGLKDAPFRLREPAVVPCDFTQRLRIILAHPYLPPLFLCVAFSCLSLGLYCADSGDVFALEIGLPTQLWDGHGVHFWPRRERQSTSGKSLSTFFKFGRQCFN